MIPTEPPFEHMLGKYPSKSERIQELEAQNARLLAVARAAAVAFPELRGWIDRELCGTKMYKEEIADMDGWEEALDAVEDLLKEKKDG